DFNVVDHRVGEDVEVGRADRAARTGRRHAATVEQDQGTGRTQAAQRQSVDARAAVDDEAAESVVDLCRAAGDGGALEQAGSRGETGEGGLFAGDHLDRRHRVERVARNARTGDGDRAEFGGFV